MSRGIFSKKTNVINGFATDFATVYVPISVRKTMCSRGRAPLFRSSGLWGIRHRLHACIPCSGFM